jgi:hypothetical protein
LPITVDENTGNDNVRLVRGDTRFIQVRDAH